MDDNIANAAKEGDVQEKESSQTQPSTSPDPRTIQELVATATDRTLEFLSTASNETLGACLVGLGATTYIILGRVGLVLIGVVGGVALHAGWESKSHAGQEHAIASNEKARKKESGLDVVRRVLDWKDKRRPGLDSTTMDEGHRESAAVDYLRFRPETAAALNIFTDAVVNDYVKWWYSPIVPSDMAFPSACRSTLTAFILSLSSHLANKCPADTLLDFVTNSSSIVVVFLSELQKALSASGSVPLSDSIQIYLDSNPDCSLASLLDRKQQERKLQQVADDVLESFLDVNVYRCAPARLFLREILGSLILETTIRKCSGAEWINEWILYLLEEVEPEFLEAIDAGNGESAVGRVGDKLESENGTGSTSVTSTQRRRATSAAEEAMDDAMQEAQRLTRLINDQDAKDMATHDSAAQIVHDDLSESTTHGLRTPTSSQSDEHHDERQNSDLKGEMPTESLLTEHDYESSQTFLSFDQLAPVSITTPATEEPPPLPVRPVPTASLFKATIHVYDDDSPESDRILRSRPTVDYMIMIEPAASSKSKYPGWMMSRTYNDFTTLHEILRRISTISGITFANHHAILPPWRGSTADQLREALELYVVDAVSYEQLAESEGLKRFLEKDRGSGAWSNTSQKNTSWPTPTAFENMGKGMLDVLTKAPKDVAGGSKAFFGGITSALTGGIPANLRKPSASPYDKGKSMRTNSATWRDARSPSHDGLRRVSTQNPYESMDGARRSSSSSRDLEPRSSMSSRRSSAYGDGYARQGLGMTAASRASNADLILSPPPSDITDDFLPPLLPKPMRPAFETHTSQMSVDGTSFFDVPTPSMPSTPARTSPAGTPANERASLQFERSSNQLDGASGALPISTQSIPSRQQRTHLPFSTQEAVITTELLFAVITSLYTLSSAWNIRRTLLAAAKTFLLRPGNPQLESIRALIQTSLLDANSTDPAIATHILKLRENALPTPEELKSWPKPRDAAQREELRVKARRLLVERGMPQALTSVMGAAASGEALGKVFDALQIEDVARGVVFALVLQGIRAVVQ